MKSPRQMGKGERRAHQAKRYQLESNLSYLALWIEQETVKTAKETSFGKSRKETYNCQPGRRFNLEAHLYLCLNPAHILANILLQKLIQRLKEPKGIKGRACE